MKHICLLMGALLLAGCVGSGPEKPLREMASALTKKDSALFLAQIDMKRFAAAQINNLTRSDTALRTLDNMGKFLGLGGMDDLLGSVMNMEIRLEEQFTRTVSTGELALQCHSATSPDCPWVPQALQSAIVKELSPTAAVARITTPANISSWLALQKIGDAWKVVGQAPLEKEAARYALESLPNESAAPSAPGNGSDASQAPAKI